LAVFITILIVLLVLNSILLVGIILLQRGKGQGLAGAFGVGGMEEALGSHAASTAQKITAILAVTFMVLCVATAYLKQRQHMQVVASRQAATAEQTGSAPKSPSAQQPAAPAQGDKK
jgi:preprotein translocase subunit SecG